MPRMNLQQRPFAAISLLIALATTQAHAAFTDPFEKSTTNQL
jgi:hypothetical protein